MQIYKYGIKQTILTNGILLENIIFLLITKSHTNCNMATVVALIKCIFNALLKKRILLYSENIQTHTQKIKCTFLKKSSKMNFTYYK